MHYLSICVKSLLLGGIRYILFPYFNTSVAHFAVFESKNWLDAFPKLLVKAAARLAEAPRGVFRPFTCHILPYPLPFPCCTIIKGGGRLGTGTCHKGGGACTMEGDKFAVSPASSILVPTAMMKIGVSFSLENGIVKNHDSKCRGENETADRKIFLLQGQRFVDFLSGKIAPYDSPQTTFSFCSIIHCFTDQTALRIIPKPNKIERDTIWGCWC